MTIRRAEPSDVPALHALIHELARFEREPDAVAASEADLHAALFGDEAVLFAELACEGDTVVGAALWFVSYSTWTGRRGIKLEDLVVTASARGRGHGRALLARLASLCVERGWTRVDWHVLDWNVAAQGAYRAVGAQPLTDWVPWRLSGPALAALADDT